MCDRHRAASARDPLLCILPPYILDAIARNGTARQRAAALESLSTDQLIRTQRAAAMLLPLLAAIPPAATPKPAAPRPKRTIYDAGGAEALPGKVVRKERGRATKDAAADEAYGGLGATFTFYLKACGRNSIDGAGMPLDATVHFGERYDNAFWNGSQMVFGDGDGELFNRFTLSLDVIGHELTHGVTAREANLVYRDQSGALNESLSDVFGSLIKQYALKQSADKADWLIGAGLFTAKVHGLGIRSMKAPGTAYDDRVLGKDPQPAHMSSYVATSEDNGGVHLNSGIPNRAFYLAATALGGKAWEVAGRIWYEAACDPKLKPTANFAEFANLAAATGERLYGKGSAQAAAVRDAWKMVGVL